MEINIMDEVNFKSIDVSNFEIVNLDVLEGESSVLVEVLFECHEAHLLSEFEDQFVIKIIDINNEDIRISECTIRKFRIKLTEKQASIHYKIDGYLNYE